MTPRRIVKNRDLISFVDLGSGPIPFRVGSIAKNRERRDSPGKFESVDQIRVIPVDRHENVLGHPNIKFRQRDVFKYLREQRRSSVKVVNDDLLLDEMAVFKMLLLTDPESPSFGRGGNPFARAAAGGRELMREYLAGVHKILVPNGRFFVSITGLFRRMLESELEQAGFKITSQKRLTRKDVANILSISTKGFFEGQSEVREILDEFVKDRELLQTYGHPANAKPEDISSIFP